MLYRTMPNGDELSILGFGAMRMPTLKDGSIDQPRAIRQIHDCIDRGVNYIDTAWPYHGCQSEPLVGTALADGLRNRVKIATKLPSWAVESRAAMDRYLNSQLKKLQTDRIDYYLLHALDGNSWDKLHGMDVIEFLESALADGRIINAGFSFHGSADDFTRIVDAYPWTFCQIQYNYLDQQLQAGTAGLEYAAAKGLGVIVMEPLRGGNIAVPKPPTAVQAIWDESETKRTPAEWALRWVWDRPEVTVVLSGMNDEAHIDENIAIACDALPHSLTDAERELVDRVAAKYRELMKVPCTSCGYCLPCPAEVMIPAIFEVYNKMHMFGNESEGRFMYAAQMCGGLSNREPGFASQCTRCGQCVEKCPQQIQIPDALETIAEELEGPDLEARVTAAKAMFKGESP